MKILPIDIKQQEFKKIFRGFSIAEVNTFLEVLAQAFEELILENNSLKDELRRHINQVNDYREKESTLKETMLTAQQISDDIKSSAKKEGELKIREAEVKAERIIGDAHHKMLKIMDRIHDLKMDRVRFAAELKSLLEKHQTLLDITLEEESGSEKNEANLAYLKAINKKGKEP